MRSISGCLLGLMALVALPTYGTTLLRADVARLAVHSSRVVRGTVVRVKAHWAGEGHIVTDVTVKVAETLAGKSSSTVVIRQPGGTVGDIAQTVGGEARFEEGEQVVVFIQRRGPTRFRLTGMAQGKFRVEKTADGLVAVPSPTKGAVLIDPGTHRPTAARMRPVSLEKLRTEIRHARVHVRSRSEGDAPSR